MNYKKKQKFTVTQIMKKEIIPTNSAEGIITFLMIS